MSEMWTEASEDSIFQRITKEYYSLTTAEKKLANFIMANGSRSQQMSISELANACGVAEATLSRFCRRIGYSGYSAFRLAIASTMATRSEETPLSGEILPEDSVPMVCSKVASTEMEAIRETQSLIDPENLKNIADVLLSAKQVFCMGQGGSMLLAQEAAHLFTTILPGFFSVQDSHMQIITTAGLSEQDVILFFSYSGSTRDLLDVLHLAKKRKVKLILITRYSGSPGAKLADYVLLCGSSENPLQLGSISARIAQLYLMDVLFSEICRRDLPRFRHQRESIADALSEKHI